MTITVSTPDGGTASFPDGTPQDTMESALSAKFHSPSAGTPDGANPYGFAESALSSGTAHLSDRALATVTPGGYDTVQKQKAQYDQEHPVLSGVAGLIGYGMGFGKLGMGDAVAGKLATAGAGPRLAGGLGTAAEFGASGTASRMVDDPANPGGAVEGGAGDALLGLGMGSVLGHFGGPRAVTSPVGEALAAGGEKSPVGSFAPFRSDAPQPTSIEDLQAQQAAAIAKMKATPVDSDIVGNKIDSAVSSLRPGELSGLSPGFVEQVGRVRSINENLGDNLTVDDVNSFQRNIGSAMRSPADTIAGARIGEALRSLYPEQQQAANLASARIKDMGWLGSVGARDAPAQAAAKIAPGSGMAFDDAGRAAMQNIADTAANNNTFTGMARNLANVGTDKLAGTAGHIIGSQIGAMAGGPIGAVAGAFAPDVLKYLANRVTNASTLRAIKAAQIAISTGRTPPEQTIHPIVPWALQAARQALAAHAANQ
jgi:hypothetical protein